MKTVILSFCYLLSVIVFSAENTAFQINPEIAELLVKGKLKKAIKMSSDEALKNELLKLLKLNKLVAESFELEVGKEISIQIRSKKIKGTLIKVKGTKLYIKNSKNAASTTTVKIKSLSFDFRMKRISIPNTFKNLYFGVKALRQKNYPAAEFYLKQTDSMSEPLLLAADKASKYIISLSAACVSGNLEKTKELLEKDADVNGQIIIHMRNEKTKKLEKIDSTILIETIKHKQDEIIRYLIKHGADINQANSKGVTPLMFAIMYFPQKLDIVEFLLNHQARMNQKDKSGNTPLTGAVGIGRIDAVKLLIKHGANVNSPSKKGFTPLMIAVSSNNVAMFKLLLDKGADVKKRHPQGWTVLQMDRKRMHPEIRAVLDKIAPVKPSKRTNFSGFSPGGVKVVPRR